MKTKILAAFTVRHAARRRARPIDRGPVLKPGDTWTYINTVEIGPNGWRQTRDQISVQRTTSEHIYVETQQSGTTQAPRELIVDADWSRSRSVNGTDTW